jgi:hypothetical protein
VLLGGVFLAAAVQKIANPFAFALSLARLQVLPRPALGPVAIALPWIEAVGAAALLGVPPFREAALRLLLGLLVAFTAVLVLAAARGSAGCGCFGTVDGFWGRTEVGLVRNLLLAGIAAALVVRGRRRAIQGPRAA